MSPIDKSWDSVLSDSRQRIKEIVSTLDPEDYFPEEGQIFRALSLPLNDVRTIILGQDPYPSFGYAEGLAFSVSEEISPIPRSLKNIFIEYCADTGYTEPRTGHLGAWAESGVLLLNRILTVAPGKPLSHKNIGWEEVTDSILAALANRRIPIICWGSPAFTSAVKVGFAERDIVASPHPSPLSAHRGFFGSRPFSRVNDALLKRGLPEISWKLP